MTYHDDEIKTDGTFRLDKETGVIRHLLIFRNGNLAAFDAAGNQMAAIQGRVDQMLEKLWELIEEK